MFKTIAFPAGTLQERYNKMLTGQTLPELTVSSAKELFPVYSREYGQDATMLYMYFAAQRADLQSARQYGEAICKVVDRVTISRPTDIDTFMQKGYSNFWQKDYHNFFPQENAQHCFSVAMFTGLAAISMGYNPMIRISYNDKQAAPWHIYTVLQSGLEGASVVYNQIEGSVDIDEISFKDFVSYFFHMRQYIERNKNNYTQEPVLGGATAYRELGAIIDFYPFAVAVYDRADMLQNMADVYMEVAKKYTDCMQHEDKYDLSNQYTNRAFSGLLKMAYSYYMDAEELLRAYRDGMPFDSVKTEAQGRINKIRMNKTIIETFFQ